MLSHCFDSVLSVFCRAWQGPSSAVPTRTDPAGTVGGVAVSLSVGRLVRPIMHACIVVRKTRTRSVRAESFGALALTMPATNYLSLTFIIHQSIAGSSPKKRPGPTPVLHMVLVLPSVRTEVDPTAQENPHRSSPDRRRCSTPSLLVGTVSTSVMEPSRTFSKPIYGLAQDFRRGKMPQISQRLGMGRCIAPSCFYCYCNTFAPREQVHSIS